MTHHEPKRLYRSETNKVLAGICGGLGEYWDIDPVVIRLLWLVATVFSGFVLGIIAYILALFIVPKRPGGRVVYEATAEESKDE